MVAVCSICSSKRSTDCSHAVHEAAAVSKPAWLHQVIVHAVVVGGGYRIISKRAYRVHGP